MNALSGQDPEEVLAPRMCDVSVLFCDLRGFSKTSEQMADNLLELLARVSEALGITTARILDHGGVIGDFHGDSAMGFWGWPLEPTDQNESAVAAVRAALEIQDEVAKGLQPNLDASDSQTRQQFQFGMGIASGKAVAGKIGTQDQVKVTAFGPVVNLASRLEGMTRLLDSSILADQETVRRIVSNRPEGSPIARSLGTFQPFGMESSLDVFQLIPEGQLSGADLQAFERALVNFQSGQWSLANNELAKLLPIDSAGQFFTRFIQKHGGSPPADWDGVVRLQVK